MKLPTLYKKTSTGADQMWEISFSRNTITTRFGQVDGKIQETSDVIKTGKNIGRSNETSPEEQAELEAKAQWEKKKTAKGYVESLSDARKGKVDKLVEGGIFPMLAQRFDEQGHKIVYPALVQPKFDGHRCIAMIDGGEATLWSRTRKPITGLPHINAALEQLARDNDIVDIVLDGELYNHSYRAKFEELTSFIRNPEPKDGHEVVEYHIYDIAGLAEQKFRTLTLTGMHFSSKTLVRVETVPVTDEDDLMLAFERFLVQGYEGLMVRNMAGEYIYHPTKRSPDLQKVKEFIDEEFVIVGIEEGRGKLAGHGIFVCKTKDKVEFRAKMIGELESLKQYFENPRSVIGKLLTVKFQGYTAKNGVPRFPVALRLRENI